MDDSTLELGDDEAPPRAPGIAVGATVGHFRIGRELGAGGMGVVFEAYDPDLDRKVAIKVVGERGRAAGLVAEAKAMARLAHPNVVAVHEVGTVDDRVYVAMELVDGPTLERWLATPHAWREVARVFAQAGDGLGAAHAAGLLHGDFKPANVLVDHSGRVRVADFGLARALDQGPLATGSRPAGTPGYIAPEQLAGGPVDARADQYSFAVALRSALGGRGPRRLARAIDRALSPDPAARFPELAELVGELRRAEGSRRRVAIAAIAMLGAAAAIGVVIVASPRAVTDDCDRGLSLIDAVRSGAQPPPAAAKLVDDWVDAWRLGRRSACAAPAAERSARLACLDTRLAELRAQLSVWARGDRETIEHGVDAAAALPSPSTCAAPPSAQVSPRLAERIAELEALHHSGHSADAARLVPALLADADATGDAATQAAAYESAAVVEHALNRDDDAAAHARRAAGAAAQIGDDGKLVAAMLDEATIATDRGHALEAVGIVDGAAAFAARVTDLTREQLAVARGDALSQAGRVTEAVTELQRGVALAESLARRDRAQRLVLAAALGALGGAEALASRYADARTHLLRGLAIEEVDYGPNHPEVAKTLHDLAIAETRLQHYDDAIAHYQRARAIFVTAYGEHNRYVALTDLQLANLARQRNDDATARPLYDRAIAALAADDPARVEIELAYGTMASAADHCADALPHFDRARELAAKIALTGPTLASIQINQGECLAELHRDADALTVLQAGRAELEREAMPAADRAEPDVTIAEIEWRAGKKDHALAVLRAALADVTTGGETYRAQRDYIAKELATWTHSP